MMKQSLKKQPTRKAGRIIKTLTSLDFKARSIIHSIAARVLGFQWLKWLHLRELTIIQGNE
jgi:hypothetical protein